MHKTATHAFRDSWIGFIHDLQDRICAGLESVEPKVRFLEETWQRHPDGTGGGGKTRIIANGEVFEKGGVNTSVVFGTVTEKMSKYLNLRGDKWFACGLSVVMHPLNPFVPTVHCNYRYFELYENDEVVDRWFGGGTDLTPYYLFEEDARHFHQTYKDVCDRFDPAFYNSFKSDCDEYFINAHRNTERRGIGGIFYDHKRPDEIKNIDFWFEFGQACGDAFLKAYMPIVNKRKAAVYNEKHIFWQEIRRGRYVEFNLVHDRGTTFGLKTNGRTESILMSLPPRARWEYSHLPTPGTEEDKLLQACLHPVNWIDKIPMSSGKT